MGLSLPFIPTWFMLRPFAPELTLICTIVGVLLTPFFTPKRSNVACGLVALIGVVIALIFAIAGSSTQDVVFRGLLVADPLAALWKILLLLFVAGVIVMWFSTTASAMHEGDAAEFFTLLLGATIGMSLMGATSNLLMLFMSVELASLPSYVLAGFRKTHRLGAEASLKYVLFGAATSSIMAYGLSLLYGLYGTLQLEQISSAISTSSLGVGGSALLAVAMVAIIIGIGFKIAAVPFHFWCPDVFEGAGIDVSAFLSVASKGAGLVLLLRILTILADARPDISLTSVAVVIGVLGAITATAGNVAAFTQMNIKRLLAYSSIAHAGYMLCALSFITKPNAQVILFYLAVYLFMNLGAFTVAALVSRHSGGEKITDYAGLGTRSPALAICMATFMVSLVGLPPVAGFNAKLNVMIALGAGGGWWWALVAVIGINTVLSLYYYLRIVKLMYLTESKDPGFFPNPIGLGLSVLCAAMLFIMFIGYSPLTRLTTAYAKVSLPTHSTPTATVAQAP